MADEDAGGDTHMIVGYVLLGILAGLLASGVALLAGASLWIVLGLYMLIGSITLALLPVAKILLNSLSRQPKATANRVYPQGNTAFIVPSVVQSATVTEPSMRILAVDDDPFLLELIPLISAKAGFSEVTLAATGEQALGLLMTPDTNFDCLLLDISMPGMDGIELCRHVRQMSRYRKTPIIMLTAMRDMQNMGDAYRAGATDYATKPFEIENLGTRLRIAQDMVQAQRKAGPVRQETIKDHRRNLIPNHNLELPTPSHLKGVGSLVNHTALLSYLTQLPRKEAADVQVFAISIDEIAAVYARSSFQHFAALLEDLASVVVECLEPDQTVMAYTDNATLLIATNSVHPLPSFNIEIEIERLLQRKASRHRTDDDIRGIAVSVGRSITPQGAKADRARMTTDLAITFANNRSFDKQGSPIVNLPRS